MYVVTDCTTSPPRHMEMTDPKDVADFIFNVTGNKGIAQKVMSDASSMAFGDVLIGNPYYIIDCAKGGEEE